jgi:ABC-type sugar transport system substrate-binding protein
MKFAIIPMFVGHPWFVRCEMGAKKAAEELGIDYVFIGPEKADTAKQLDIFTDQVNKGVDAIILAVSEAEVWEKPVQMPGIREFPFSVSISGRPTPSGWRQAGNRNKAV